MNEIKNDLKAIQDSILALTKINTAMDGKLQNLESKMADDFKQLSEDIQDIKSSNATLSNELNEIRTTQEKKFEDLDKRTDGLAADLVENTTKLNKVESTCIELDGFKVSTKEDLKSLHDTNTTVSAELAGFRATLNTGTIGLQQTKVKIETLETDVAGVKHDLANLKERGTPTVDNAGDDDDAPPKPYYTIEETDEYSKGIEDTIETMKRRLAAMEYHCHRSQQNSRKFNLEFDGIPVAAGDDPAKLEDVVMKLVDKMGVPCTSNDIEAVHRLPSKNPDEVKGTIVRLHRRKLRDDILKNKLKLKNLKDFNVEIDGLNETTKIYVKPNQCPYYKTLAYNCRVLKRNELISSTSVDDDGSVKIQLLNGKVEKILHENKLRFLFPQFEDFKFIGSER